MNPIAAKAAVNGGKPFTVHYEDGGQETVFVRSLRERDFLEFTSLVDSESNTAEFLTQKKAPWADRLTHESLAALVDIGLEVNAAFFPWVKRKRDRLKRLSVALEPSPEESSSTPSLPISQSEPA